MATKLDTIHSMASDRPGSSCTDSTEIVDSDSLDSRSENQTEQTCSPVYREPVSCPTDIACEERIVDFLTAAEDGLAEIERLEHLTPPVEATRRNSRTTLDLSIVIPVYNERETIAQIVDQIRTENFHQEIILVDDYSLDGTRDVLLELDQKFDEVRILLLGYNQGKGAALRAGFKIATGSVILIQDPDLVYSPTDYQELLAPLEQGKSAVVYGSRFLEKRLPVTTPTRRFANWFLTTASNLVSGYQLTDMQTCCKVFRRNVLAEMELKQNGFGFDPEFTAKLSQGGFEIIEVPIAYDGYNYDPGNRVTWRDAVASFFYIFRYAK